MNEKVSCLANGRVDQVENCVDHNAGIFSKLAEVAEQNMSRVALRHQSNTLSYKQLIQAANALSYRLQQHGVGIGDVVALYSHSSIEAIVALVAISQIGAVYLPLQPDDPLPLLENIFRDSGAVLALEQGSLIESTHSTPCWRGSSVRLSSDYGKGEATPALLSPDHAAYIMYTSGSTGEAKGVVIPQRGILRLTHNNNVAQLSKDDVFYQLAPLAFDAATFEIWGALLNGATLVIPSAPRVTLDQIGDDIERYQVTTLWLTAGLFHLMVKHRLSKLKPLRNLLAGGDVLSPKLVATAVRALPNCQIINGYGPTENTTFTCCYHFPQDYDARDTAPIGTAIKGTDVYILDHAMQIVADGEPGELYTSGAGLALGYLNRPELTANVFLDNPFCGSENTKLYRTGDRVRRRADGNIEFLGRIDRQIKLNGKRIELANIERTLRQHPLVDDATITTVRNSESAVTSMNAYVITNTAYALNINQIGNIRTFLAQHLPATMLPANIMCLDEFPLTKNGKVDVKKLPTAGPDLHHNTSGLATQIRQIEEKLLHVWQHVLNRESINYQQKFFDLGGTSLQILEVQALLSSLYNLDISIIELFQYPSISALTAHLKQSTSKTNPVMHRQNHVDKRKQSIRQARLRKQR